MSRLWAAIRAEPYAWVMIVIAALAMVATLPGRTHGLGMITERLLRDPALELGPYHAELADPNIPDTKLSEDAKRALAARRLAYADLNLWATLLGGLFCLPCGYLIDRFGLRITLTITVLSLGAVVVGMTHVTGWWSLFILLILSRGFGQSALSVISISMVGKWFGGRQSLPMAIYSLILSLGFAMVPQVAKNYVNSDWRVLWGGIGWVLLVAMVPIALLLTRDPRRAPDDEATNSGWLPNLNAAQDGDQSPNSNVGFTLLQAMQTPAFWVFGLSISMIALIGSGKSLFNESILSQQHFPKETFYNLLTVSGIIGLVMKLPVGWLGLYVPLNRLNAVGLFLLAGGMFWLPHIFTYHELVIYAVLTGISGTITTVLFFSIWGQAYGKAHLGQIQSVAQMMTVLASALGPIAYARCFAYFGSYAPVFNSLAGVIALLGAWSLLIRIPSPSEAPQAHQISYQLKPAPETAT